MASDQSETGKSEGLRLRARLRYLYHGTQPAAVKFRLMVIVVDLIIIGFFLLPETKSKSAEDVLTGD